MLSNKDPVRALDYVQGQIKRMDLPCTLNNSGCLVQFFPRGYCSREFQVTPSGITLFMCHPKTVPKAMTFQTFLRKLVNIIATAPTGTSPITIGRESLQWEMSNDIASIFALVKFGHLPKLNMPVSIVNSATT